MKKAYTVYLELKTYENLKAFAEKKKWSLTQAMEYILQKIVNKPNVKQKESI
jgi:hypothetical protein